MTILASLDLVGDGDDEDLVRNLERVFDVRFEPADLARVHTLGDLHDLIAAAVPVGAETDRWCLTSRSFYALRRALRSDEGEVKITPRTAIDELISSNGGDRLRRLEGSTALRMPAKEHTIVGGAGLFACLIGLGLALAEIALRQPWPDWSGLLVFGAGALLCSIDPGRLPASIRTVGDLSRAVADLNYGRLVRAGGRGDADLWPRFAALVAEIDDYDPARLAPTTTLFTPRR